MAISKIIYKASAEATPEVWMDTTQKTVAANNLLTGETALGADGEDVVGEYVPQSGGGYVYKDSEGYIVIDSEGGGGGASVPVKDINFIDYDGTVLYSYTFTEWEDVEELPANPSHAGLISQGWNWTLEELNAEALVNSITTIWVGQMYTTASGATEIDIELIDPEYLSPYLMCTPVGANSSMSIDWGDGSTPTIVNYTGDTQFIPHTYQSIGRYTISMSIINGSWYHNYCAGGYNSPGLLVSAPGSNERYRNPVYANSIKMIRVGNNYYMAPGCFRTLGSVKYITLPNTIRQAVDSTNYPIHSYCFSQDYSLESLTIPRGVVSGSSSGYTEELLNIKNISLPKAFLTGPYFYQSHRCITKAYLPSNITEIPVDYFNGCLGLQNLTLPNGLTTIGNNAFQTCGSFTDITIPASVTTIGTDAFRYNYGMLTYHFLPTTPPTLGNSTVFGGINSEAKIYVPAASVNAYKTATNWSAYADYIQAEPS